MREDAGIEKRGQREATIGRPQHGQGDDDRRDWQEGIEQLGRAGFSAIMVPPSRPVRDLLFSETSKAV